ncbi:MAG: hypothetical protein LBC12_03355 [Nitrososphaerota archaeon]|jgi:hypothetical protein|nr:hypothetical protein [Nitrososphaerota archaeon]
MVATDKHIYGKNAFIIILILAGLSSIFITRNNFSWIKLLTISLLGVGGVIWLLSTCLLRRTVKFWRTVKYVMIAVSIFAISFSAFEGYVFRNAGYPPTFDTPQSDVTISYTNKIDVSLTELVQSAKSTLAFKLLRLEHPGEVCIMSIWLLENQVSVSFSLGSSATCYFEALIGNPYHVSVLSGNGASFHQEYPLQQRNEDFQQIDILGLQWYYDRAIEAYQNETGTTPEINRLSISIQTYNPSEQVVS